VSKGRILAALSSERHLLYLAETAKPRVHVVNLDNGQLLATHEFSSLACPLLSSNNGQKHAREEHGELVGAWEQVPGTAWAHMEYCGSRYLVDMDKLEIARIVVDGNVERGGVILSRSGNRVLVSTTRLDTGVSTTRLYAAGTWDLLQEWDTRLGGAAAVSPDGKRVILLQLRLGESRKDTLRCAIEVRELPTLRLISAWDSGSADGNSDACPLPLTLIGEFGGTFLESALLPHPRTGVNAGFRIRRTETGEIVQTIQDEITIATTPSFSPDGRFAVAGAWDDPQDNAWSQDFKIWDVRTGLVIYETQKYRSVWGKRTRGREVYPSFSSDGRYLLVVYDDHIEVYELPGHDEPSAP